MVELPRARGTDERRANGFEKWESFGNPKITTLKTLSIPQCGRDGRIGVLCYFSIYVSCSLGVYLHPFHSQELIFSMFRLNTSPTSSKEISNASWETRSPYPRSPGPARMCQETHKVVQERGERFNFCPRLPPTREKASRQIMRT